MRYAKNYSHMKNNNSSKSIIIHIVAEPTVSCPLGTMQFLLHIGG